MVALLDVNVLIALLDTSHTHHSSTTQWLSTHLHKGHALCALTYNGRIRILSQSGYSNRAFVAEVTAGC